MFGPIAKDLFKHRLKPRRGKSTQERRFTLLLVSSHGRSQSVSFSIRATQIALALTLVATATLCLFVRNYRSNRHELDELRYMRDVAESQREQIGNLEEQYSSLTERLRQAELVEAQIREMLDSEGVLPQSYSPVAEVASQQRSLRTVSRDSTLGRSASAVEMARTLYALQAVASNLEADAASINDKADSLHQRATEIVRRLRATPSTWPVYGDITSEYGWRRHPLTYAKEFHDGVDIAASSWTPIKATADGVVTFSGYKSGYGWMVTLKHNYSYETLYAHCVRLEARVGKQITRGDVIAYVGQSGSATGPHLHYEIRLSGASTNPTEYLPDDSTEVKYSVR